MLMHTHCCRRVSVYVYVSVSKYYWLNLKNLLRSWLHTPRSPICLHANFAGLRHECVGEQSGSA